MIKKTIFTGFSPNSTRRDTLKALRFLCQPWRWSGEASSTKVETWLREYFHVQTAQTFDSGRTALFFALKSLGIKKGDCVLVQPYTCVVVINAIRFAGAEPVYVDVGDDLGMDPSDLEKKITDDTKVVIIQHTFGVPARLDELLALAKKNNVRVIEDCAHALGVLYQNRLVGTIGDIGMLSFGSDKVVSCVRGGALITDDERLGEKIKEYRAGLSKTKPLLVFQHLMHYPLFFVGRMLYPVSVGKWILAIAKRVHIMNRIIYRSEKRGESLAPYPSLLPEPLANILLDQLDGLDSMQKHRKAIADQYDRLLDPSLARQKMGETAVPVRYALFVPNKEKLHREAKKKGVLLGNWYDTLIAPSDIDMAKMHYKKGGCPTAERLSDVSINLPTNRHMDSKAVQRVVDIVNTLCI